MRCNDDGEPSQTAGRPMLDVLLGEDVHNCCAVVTRYFGGTLLGTGGLVRAYSGAVKEGLKNSVIVEKRLAEKLTVQTDYTGLGKIQYILGEENITVLDSEYTDQVVLTLLVPVDAGGAAYGKAHGGDKRQMRYREGGKALLRPARKRDCFFLGQTQTSPGRAKPVLWRKTVTFRHFSPQITLNLCKDNVKITNCVNSS